MDDYEIIQQYREGLAAVLQDVCNGEGFFDGRPMGGADFDEAWLRYAPSYYGDAVRNFNEYPEYCLACAGYLGMAVALLWDKDWARHQHEPYSFFQGGRGFDDMDDHITGSILKESKHSVAAMQSCSGAAYHYLLRQSIEPGTADAYRKFLVSAEEMYKIGVAIELRKLGYKWEKI